MVTINDYVHAFVKTFELDKMQARRISISEYNPPSDAVILNYANIYHYGQNKQKNLNLAYELYAYAHHKNNDVTQAIPVNPVSIMQYIELMRELESAKDESSKIFGFEDAGDYYMWECDLLDVAIRNGFSWVMPYIFEKIIECNGEDHEADEFGTYRIPTICDEQLSKTFKDWKSLYEIIKASYIG